MKSAFQDLKSYKRIAIMGGTFDPIHYGHLVTAEAVRHEYNIEKVLFIPTGHPPHKDDVFVTSNEHRYLMTVLATVANPYFDVSRIEIDRSGYTYTVDTIIQLRAACNKNTKLYFITGADAIHQILTWKDAEKLLTLCSFIAVTRPGYSNENLSNHITELKQKYKMKLHFLEVPALAISSTEIRSRVSKGLPIKYLLPEEVEKYIYKLDLYANKPDIEAIDRMLRNTLSEKRYAHTMGVANEAAKLARYYGEDQLRAYSCGLLHDCGKEFSADEKRKLCKTFSIKLDDIMKKQIDLAHSYISAGIAQRDFAVTDEDMLNAIKYHPTGRKNMSLLEKILIAADMTEPHRDYPEADAIRAAAFIDLDKAVILSLRLKLKFTETSDKNVHPLTQEALDYLCGAESNI